MIGHLRYLGLLLPITFSSWAAEQNPGLMSLLNPALVPPGIRIRQVSG